MLATDNANTNTCRTRQHELKLELKDVGYCFGSNFSNSVIGVVSR